MEHKYRLLFLQVIATFLGHSGCTQEWVLGKHPKTLRTLPRIFNPCWSMIHTLMAPFRGRFLSEKRMAVRRPLLLRLLCFAPLERLRVSSPSQGTSCICSTDIWNKNGCWNSRFNIGLKTCNKAFSLGLLLEQINYVGCNLFTFTAFIRYQKQIRGLCLYDKRGVLNTPVFKFHVKKQTFTRKKS